MSLPIWDDCKWDKSTETVEIDPELAKEYQFSCNTSLNRKIYLFMGQIYQLPTSAFIIGQSESLRDRSDGNDALFALAGPEMDEELLSVAPIQTGESVITKGGSLPCDWVIHAVGPKYDTRYLTASDHALFSAYNSSLLLAANQNVKSISIGCLYMSKKKYPRFDAAHVALRTVRKFLNHSVGNVFEKIVFCVPTQDDFEIYSALMTAYFPRNFEEMENGRTMLPENLGNEWGEIRISERQLKVSTGPTPLSGETLQTYRKSITTSTTTNNATMANDQLTKDDNEDYEERPVKTGNNNRIYFDDEPKSSHKADESGADADRARQQKIAEEFAKMSREDRLKKRFQAMLEDVDGENFDDFKAMNFVQFAGNDRKGRTVVWITAANLKVLQVNQERVLLYFMYLMEDLRCLPFVLVYAYSDVDEDNTPDSDFIQSIFDLFSSRYKENMQQLYILHATIMFRMYLWIALPFINTPFWSSYICVDSLKDLNTYMDLEEITVPNKVLRYDKDYCQK